MDKLKGILGKATGGSGHSSSGGSSNKIQEYTHKAVDTATDKVGMGDKYDKQISEQADKQIKNYQSKK